MQVFTTMAVHRQQGQPEAGQPSPALSRRLSALDWPRHTFSNGKPATLFQPTPANPNKIKGHGNPASCGYDFLSQRKKGDFSDSYVIF